MNHDGIPDGWELRRVESLERWRFPDIRTGQVLNCGRCRIRCAKRGWFRVRIEYWYPKNNQGKPSAL